MPLNSIMKPVKEVHHSSWVVQVDNGLCVCQLPALGNAADMEHQKMKILSNLHQQKANTDLKDKSSGQVSAHKLEEVWLAHIGDRIHIASKSCTAARIQKL